MKKYLVLLTVVVSMTIPISAGITVNGPSSLPSLKSYVQNMTIVHDGSTMNNMAELQFIKDKIAANQEPWKTYYNNLTKSGYSKLIPPVPQAAAVPTNEAGLMYDSYVIYNQALMYYFTGNVTYAQNARNFLNAWSSTFQNSSGMVNWYLAPAWSASIIAPAAELLRSTPGSGWTAADTTNLQAMFNQAFLPVLTWRYAYGNRELSVANGLLAIGIFNEDRAAIYKGLYHWVSYVPCYFYLASDGATPIKADYFTTEPNADTYWAMHSNLFPAMGSTSDWLYKYASSYPNRPWLPTRSDDMTMMTGGGSPPPYTLADQWYMGSNLKSIPTPVPAYVDGQCGETFRDLGHLEFAISAATNVAQLAWRQGIDLYSAYAGRLTKAVELHAGFRLSKPLPPALANSGVLTQGDGLAAPFEIAYNHFGDSLGYSMPNTLQLLGDCIRKELWYQTTPPAGIFANKLWGQNYYHIQWESLLHQGLPPETLFPTAGLVGYYKFEQNTNDGSGSGNNGTPQAGFSYSADAMEDLNSGQFDGNGGRVVVPNGSSQSITGNMTLAAWIKVQSPSFASRPNIIAKSFNNGYRLRFNTDGTLNLLLGNGTSSPTQFNGTQIVSFNQWVHVAAVIGFNSGTVTVKFYVNGTPDSTVPTAALSAIQAGTGSLVLGTRVDQTSSTESLNGRLDQVTIYNRALSAEEISQLVQ